MQNIQIAQQLSTTRETVGKWRKRFDERGIEGLYDELRPGRPRSIEEERLAELEKDDAIAVDRRRRGVDHPSVLQVNSNLEDALASAGET